MQACTIDTALSRNGGDCFGYSEMQKSSTHSCLKASIGWSREALNAG